MHERERWHLILNRLRERGIVRVNDLAELTGASLATLRRDLDGLAAEGVIDRTHGGALLRQQASAYGTFEPETEAAAELSPLEKAAIGQAAARPVGHGYGQFPSLPAQP